jgi:hypothetical protein
LSWTPHETIKSFAFFNWQLKRVATQVLAEAKDEELLFLSPVVSRRLERLTELRTAEAPRCELRFAAGAPAPDNPALVGRLLTTAPDPDRCVLHTEGTGNTTTS